MFGRNYGFACAPEPASCDPKGVGKLPRKHPKAPSGAVTTELSDLHSQYDDGSLRVSPRKPGVHLDTQLVDMANMLHTLHLKINDLTSYLSVPGGSSLLPQPTVPPPFPIPPEFGDSITPSIITHQLQAPQQLPASPPQPQVAVGMPPFFYGGSQWCPLDPLEPHFTARPQRADGSGELKRSKSTTAISTAQLSSKRGVPAPHHSRTEEDRKREERWGTPPRSRSVGSRLKEARTPFDSEDLSASQIMLGHTPPVAAPAEPTIVPIDTTAAKKLRKMSRWAQEQQEAELRDRLRHLQQQAVGSKRNTKMKRGKRSTKTQMDHLISLQQYNAAAGAVSATGRHMGPPLPPPPPPPPHPAGLCVPPFWQHVYQYPQPPSVHPFVPTPQHNHHQPQGSKGMSKHKEKGGTKQKPGDTKKKSKPDSPKKHKEANKHTEHQPTQHTIPNSDRPLQPLVTQSYPLLPMHPGNHLHTQVSGHSHEEAHTSSTTGCIGLPSSSTIEMIEDHNATYTATTTNTSSVLPHPTTSNISSPNMFDMSHSSPTLQLLTTTNGVDIGDVICEEVHTHTTHHETNEVYSPSDPTMTSHPSYHRHQFSTETSNETHRITHSSSGGSTWRSSPIAESSAFEDIETSIGRGGGHSVADVASRLWAVANEIDIDVDPYTSLVMGNQSPHLPLRPPMQQSPPNTSVSPMLHIPPSTATANNNAAATLSPPHPYTSSKGCNSMSPSSTSGGNPYILSTTPVGGCSMSSPQSPLSQTPPAPASPPSPVDSPDRVTPLPVLQVSGPPPKAPEADKLLFTPPSPPPPHHNPGIAPPAYPVQPPTVFSGRHSPHSQQVSPEPENNQTNNQSREPQPRNSTRSPKKQAKPKATTSTYGGKNNGNNQRASDRNGCSQPDTTGAVNVTTPSTWSRSATDKTNDVSSSSTSMTGTSTTVSFDPFSQAIPIHNNSSSSPTLSPPPPHTTEHHSTTTPTTCDREGTIGGTEYNSSDAIPPLPTMEDDCPVPTVVVADHQVEHHSDIVHTAPHEEQSEVQSTSSSEGGATTSMTMSSNPAVSCHTDTTQPTTTCSTSIDVTDAAGDGSSLLSPSYSQQQQQGTRSRGSPTTSPIQGGAVVYTAATTTHDTVDHQQLSEHVEATTNITDNQREASPTASSTSSNRSELQPQEDEDEVALKNIVLEEGEEELSPTNSSSPQHQQHYQHPQDRDSLTTTPPLSRGWMSTSNSSECSGGSAPTTYMGQQQQADASSNTSWGNHSAMTSPLPMTIPISTNSNKRAYQSGKSSKGIKKDGKGKGSSTCGSSTTSGTTKDGSGVNKSSSGGGGGGGGPSNRRQKAMTNYQMLLQKTFKHSQRKPTLASSSSKSNRSNASSSDRLDHGDGNDGEGMGNVEDDVSTDEHQMDDVRPPQYVHQPHNFQNVAEKQVHCDEQQGHDVHTAYDPTVIGMDPGCALLHQQIHHSQQHQIFVESLTKTRCLLDKWSNNGISGKMGTTAPPTIAGGPPPLPPPPPPLPQLLYTKAPHEAHTYRSHVSHTQQTKTATPTYETTHQTKTDTHHTYGASTRSDIPLLNISNITSTSTTTTDTMDGTTMGGINISGSGVNNYATQPTYLPTRPDTHSNDKQQGASLQSANTSCSSLDVDTQTEVLATQKKTSDILLTRKLKGCSKKPITSPRSCTSDDNPDSDANITITEPTPLNIAVCKEGGDPNVVVTRTITTIPCGDSTVKVVSEQKMLR